ncbi:hypothetical protein PR202_gb02517 [Eleusine coracana subsp. coracana]|uniref:Uncharacterized protein n=1 Tax=Eleusine coracana subsp. coracana TaxID=191504 RepID=A0AAV5DZA6_ELECO|nr:hypothetical protein QOZ80_8BG0667590 [Eleusine coracana subsp. coracana]GJN15593.1 hypothetical protein PR202_gb02517 [Eleusine coracana subsp. coracana]
MKKSIIGNKAAEFLSKAAAALRGKAGVLRARLLFLASLRRRAAVAAGISRHIRALSPPGNHHQQKPAAGSSRAVVLSRPPPVTRDDDGVAMAELARLFHQVDEEDGGDDGGRYEDWTLALRSLFDEDDEEEERRRGCGGDLDDGDEAPSVIDVIRSRREGEGREFRIDDEIDQAADMFIARVRRRRMAAQQELQVTDSGLH